MMQYFKTFESYILEAAKLTFYHGGNPSASKTFKRMGYKQKTKYWTNSIMIAKMYGRKIEKKYIPVKEINEIPVYNYNGREFNEDYQYIQEIERHLIEGTPVDIWGQYLDINPATKYVLIENIVDVPDGRLDDISDDEYDKIAWQYSSDVLIEKI